MSDLLSALDDALAGLGIPCERPFPGIVGSFPGGFPGDCEAQVIADEQISRLSRISRDKIGSSAKNPEIRPPSDFAPCAGAHARSCVKAPGNPGKPGNLEKTLAGTTGCDFPVSLSFPGKIDGNREIEAVQASSYAPSLPISLDDVRAGVARELRALAEDGREGLDALRDAVAITAAKIRNAPALAERQVHAGQCHACGSPLDDSRPLVAVLNPGGPALHLHGGECHAAHSARKAALVGSIMTAAGYGAEATGEAA